jgi:hypothetical protein
MFSMKISLPDPRQSGVESGMNAEKGGCVCNVWVNQCQSQQKSFSVDQKVANFNGWALSDTFLMYGHLFKEQSRE